MRKRHGFIVWDKKENKIYDKEQVVLTQCGDIIIPYCERCIYWEYDRVLDPNRYELRFDK